MSTTPTTFHSSMVVRRLRKQIDRLDDRLVVLLHQRVGLARELGKLKRSTGQPLRDPGREQEILQRLADSVDSSLEPGAIRQLFRCIIEISLACEERDGTSCD